MPAAVSFKFRLSARQDLALTKDPNGETFLADVGGVGPNTPLDMLAAVEYTDFVQAASAVQAALSNVGGGGVYYNTALGGLAAVCGLSLLPIVGTINGVNVVFTLPTTLTNGQLLIVRNGVVLDPTGYSIAGSVLTFRTYAGSCVVASGVATCSGLDEFPIGSEGLSITLNSTSYLVRGPVNSKRLFVTGAANGTYTFNLPLAPAAGDILYALIS